LAQEERKLLCAVAMGYIGRHGRLLCGHPHRRRLAPFRIILGCALTVLAGSVFECYAFNVPGSDRLFRGRKPKVPSKEGLTQTHQSASPHESLIAEKAGLSPMAEEIKMPPITQEAGLPREPLAIVPAETWSVLDVLDVDGQVDPYEVLGVRFLAPETAIREAYRNKCRALHPDLHGGRESTEWELVCDAYSLLSSRDRKRIYDQKRVAKALLNLSFTGAAQFLDFFGLVASTVFDRGVDFIFWVYDLGQALTQQVAIDGRNSDGSIKLPATGKTDAAHTLQE